MKLKAAIVICIVALLVLVFKNTSWAQHSIKIIDGDTLNTRTTISYLTQKELFDRNKKEADEQMWSAQDIAENDTYAKLSKGGELVLRIKRTTIEAADMEWFTVIIKKDNVEIFRSQLKKKIPSIPGSDDLWSNLKVIAVKNPVKIPFDVYVVEAGGTPPKYHFRIIN